MFLIILCTCTFEINNYQRSWRCDSGASGSWSQQKIAAWYKRNLIVSQFILWAAAIIKRRSRVNLRRNSHPVFYVHIHNLSLKYTLQCFTISFIWVWNILSSLLTLARAIWYRWFFSLFLYLKLCICVKKNLSGLVIIRTNRTFWCKTWSLWKLFFRSSLILSCFFAVLRMLTRDRSKLKWIFLLLKSFRATTNLNIKTHDCLYIISNASC